MSHTDSPRDPAFYLHHCWIDMLWAKWQLAHLGVPFVSSGAGAGLNDPMMEWPDRTPADVLDHHALSYSYDTEDVSGWHHTDLVAATGAPRALTAPSGYTWDADKTQHVVYAGGGNNHVHELWFVRK